MWKARLAIVLMTPADDQFSPGRQLLYGSVQQQQPAAWLAHSHVVPGCILILHPSLLSCISKHWISVIIGWKGFPLLNPQEKYTSEHVGKRVENRDVASDYIPNGALFPI
jgi:hypothetical protein